MPETHHAPDTVPIRPRLHRQSLRVRELRTKKTRTTGSRNVLPRLLTTLQAMWLLDLREGLEESHEKDRRDNRTEKETQRPSVIQKPRTRRSSNTKTG